MSNYGFWVTEKISVIAVLMKSVILTSGMILMVLSVLMTTWVVDMVTAKMTKAQKKMPNLVSRKMTPLKI